MTDSLNRRPLKSRQWPLIQKTARWLATKSITPNQISLCSIGCAGMAAIFLCLFPYVHGVSLWIAALLATICMAGRALCNLLDGLVAVEGGKGSRTGELFNDIPDRISDSLILVAVGYAIPMYDWASSTGWLAALLAVMTAYIRTLARSLGTPANFEGPMAKTHRIIIIAIACLLTPVESLLWQPGYILLLALLIVIFGCILTIRNRIRTAYSSLENQATELS